MEKRMAIIDLGSNSIRMNIIGVFSSGSYTVYEQVSEMVRLSEGMVKDQCLKPKAIERTEHALMYFRHLIEAYEVEEIHGLATAAVRQSINGKLVLETLKRKTGFDFRILSGDEEAYYDYLGVANTMAYENALLMDVGGGSTELIWMKGRKVKEKISLPFGSVTLSESFNQIKKAEAFIEKAFYEVKWLPRFKGEFVIGLGGVNRTIGKVNRGINQYPIDNLHNYKMTLAEVEETARHIHQTPFNQKHKIEGISKRRAEVIDFGILPLKILMRTIDAKTFVISGYGLREGYFYEKLLSRFNQPMPIPDVLMASCENLLNRFALKKEHAYTVANIATKLFLALAPEKKADLKKVKTAALLHDVGMHIDYHDHHIHGFHMVQNGRLDGITNKERFEIAYLVGSHREEPIKKHLYMNSPFWSEASIKLLNQYALLIALAEQLDRSERSLIETLQVKVTDQTILLSIMSTEPLYFEVASAMRLSDLFNKRWHKKLEIELVDRM